MLVSPVDLEWTEWANSSSALSPIVASRCRFTGIKGVLSVDHTLTIKSVRAYKINIQFQSYVFINSIPLLGVSSPFYRYPTFFFNQSKISIRRILFPSVTQTSSCTSDNFAFQEPLSPPSLPWGTNTCKKETKGALAAVCTPTLKSNSRAMKHQKLFFLSLSLLLALEKCVIRSKSVPCYVRCYPLYTFQCLCPFTYCD